MTSVKVIQHVFKTKRLFILCYISFLIIQCGSSANAEVSIDYAKYWQLAVNLAKQKSYIGAVDIFSNLIRKYPSDAELYLRRGKLKQQYLNDCQKAIMDYNIAIKLSSHKSIQAYPVEVHWYKGQCLYNLGLYKQAVDSYSNALKIKPNWGKLYLYRAKAYAKLNMINNVRKDLGVLVKYDPMYKTSADELWKKILEGRKDF
jgi:tetratricopeptide (TPR) repeat protein